MSTHTYDKNQLALEVEATGAQALNVNMFVLDCSTLPPDQGLSLHATGWGTGGTVTLGWSNDPAEVSWDETWQFDAVNSGAATINNAGIRLIPKLGRFLRARWSTAQTAGTSKVVIVAISDSSKRGVTVHNNVQVQGPAAHDGASVGNPVRAAGRAVTANYTAVASNDTADLVTTTVGALISKPYSIPEADWQYAAPSGGINVITDVVAKAAGAAGIRNYVTGLHLRNSSATATEFLVKDGATVIFRTHLPASMTFDVPVVFPTPLRGTAATALNIQCSAVANVYANMQGYQAP